MIGTTDTHLEQKDFSKWLETDETVGQFGDGARR